MAIKVLSDSIKSIRFTDFLVEREERAQLSNGKYFIGLERQDISDDEYSDLKKFLKGIGCTDEPSNYGIASFTKDGSFLRHSPAYFGKYEVDGEYKIGLMFGSNSNGMEPLFIEVKKQENDDELQPYKYYLGKRELSLKEGLDENKKPSGKLYLSVSLGLDEYTIACIFVNDYKANDVFLTFVNGCFEDSLREFNNGKNPNVYAEVNKMFNKYMQAGKMPEGGIVLLVEHGAYKESTIVEKVVISSQWRLVASNFPDLIIDTFKKENKFDSHKTTYNHILSDVTIINCPVSSQMTQYFINNEVEFFEKYALIKIIGINDKTKNSMHIPKHGFATGINTIKFLLKGVQNRELIEAHLDGTSEPLQLSAAISESLDFLPEPTETQIEEEEADFVEVEVVKQKPRKASQVKFREPTQAEIDALADF